MTNESLCDVREKVPIPSRCHAEHVEARDR